MTADHDTAIRAALAQVRDDMRAGVIEVDHPDFDDGFGAYGHLLCRLDGDTARALRIDSVSSSADVLGCRRLFRLFYQQAGGPREVAAAIDRYLAGDEPWPAKETTNAR